MPFPRDHKYTAEEFFNKQFPEHLHIRYACPCWYIRRKADYMHQGADLTNI